MIDAKQTSDRDTGAILLLVLAVTIVLSLVVLALANFIAADLRYSQVIDGRARTLASAESGIDYAIDRLRLNQTLCATDAASSAVNLNGASSPGTPLPAPLNGTDTRITCKRLDGAIADVAGWAAVIANDGSTAPNDQIQVDTNGTAVINGPVFLPDASETATSSTERVGIVDGDLWYTRADCSTPYSNTGLAAENVDILSPLARGGVCTPRISGDVFSAPPEPATLPLPPAPIYTDDSVCRVFSPGYYSSIPFFGGAGFDPPVSGSYHAYFKSGDYHFDFDTEWLIENTVIWAGKGPLSLTPTVVNDPCLNARLLDTGPVEGATFYMDRNSRIRIGDRGALEIFPRVQGNHVVSIQALNTSTTGNTRSLVRSLDTGPVQLVVHGLVWAPKGRITFDNNVSGSKQQLLGGVVAQRLWLLQFDPAGMAIGPAMSTDATRDTRILLTSTSTGAGGGSTTVEAVIEYRPQATDLADRVAVNSFRVVN